MPSISKKAKEKCLKSFGDHRTFLSRITKTLYYGKLPNTDRLSLPVTELATELFSEARKGTSLERLHCNDATTISRNACVSPCSFILAMLYLERLKSCNPEYLQRITPSELFLVSLMVSSKFLFDDGEEDEVFLDEWALSGGITKAELKTLEQEFLKAIEWNIFVNQVTFWKKLAELERTLARREGKARGWFTYAELCCLLEVIDFDTLYRYLLSISTVIVVTYAAGLLTILGAMFLASRIPGTCLAPPEDEPYEMVVLSEAPAPDIFNRFLTNLLNKSTSTISGPRFLNCYFQTFECIANPKPNKESVSWDWWNSPGLSWLSEASRLPQQRLYMLFEYLRLNFAEVEYVNSKRIDLQDQVHKGTTVRIQDQLEGSWHEEWIDILRGGFVGNRGFDYVENMKV